MIINLKRELLERNRRISTRQATNSMSQKKEEEKKTQIDTTGKKPEEAEKKKDDDMKDDKGNPLTEGDIQLFKRYGKGPYTEALKKVEDEIKTLNQKIQDMQGIKESDTGLALPTQWNIQGDR